MWQTFMSAGRAAMSLHARQIATTCRPLAPALARSLPRRDVSAAALSSKRRTKKTEAVEDAAASKDQAQKRRVLHDVIANINMKHGDGALMSLGDKPLAVAVTPSGCLTLDRALGGGYPKGRIVEIYGPESSGKTTLALHAIAEVQKAGGMAVFIDAEHAFDQGYAKKLGINTAELLVSQPDHGEMAFNVLDELVRSGAVDVVVVDSVSALTPRSEVEGDIGTPQVGAQARLMSLALRKVAANASKSGTTIIFLNQLRYKVGVLYGNPETTSGGQALKFYASIRLDIRVRDKVTSGSEVVGNRVRVKVVKNKVAPPFESAEFDVLFGAGIDALGCVLDAGEAAGVVQRKGSYYYYGETRLGQGRDRALAYLRESPDTRAAIEAAVQEALLAARREGAAAAAARAGDGAAAADLFALAGSGGDGDIGFVGEDGGAGEDDLDALAAAFDRKSSASSAASSQQLVAGSGAA